MEMGRAEPIGTTSADINHRNPVVKREKGCNTRTSQEVTHPSTTIGIKRIPPIREASSHRRGGRIRGGVLDQHFG